MPMDSVSAEFAQAWSAAGNHIETVAQGPLHSWSRAHPAPPFLAHLSLRRGNQLFFIRIESEDGRLKVPGSLNGRKTVARGCGGHAWLMPMRRKRVGWQPALPGWGLADASSGQPVHPPALISDEEIEMSDWELHDFAVQGVRQQLEDEGRDLMAWQLSAVSQ